MEYFSDSTNLYIVLFVFFVFYIYLKFVFSQIQRNKNWKSVKCNPLEMVISSIFDNDNANNSFQQCMKYSATEDIQSQLDNLSDNVDKEFAHSIEQLTSKDKSHRTATEAILDGRDDEILKLENKHMDSETQINTLKQTVENLKLQLNNAFDVVSSGGNDLLTSLKLE